MSMSEVTTWLKIDRVFFFRVAMDFASLVHVAVIWARHAGLDARMLSLIACYSYT